MSFEKLHFSFKRSDGREQTNKKLYIKLFEFFTSEFSDGLTKEKVYYTIFMLSEIIDNYFEHDSMNFSYIELEIRFDRKTKEVKIDLKDDGAGYDPFKENNNCNNIINASKKINFPSPNIGEIRGSTDALNKRYFRYNLMNGV